MHFVFRQVRSFVIEKMRKRNFLQLFLLLGLFNIFKSSVCEVIRVQCTMNKFELNTHIWTDLGYLSENYSGNRTCVISGLTLNSTNYQFVPVAPNPNIITYFRITESTVPVLTSDVCTALPKITYFNAEGQGIEIIDDYVFTNCTEITSIYLDDNYIHKVGKGIFSNMNKLKILHIRGASLELIDVDLFNNLHEILYLKMDASGLKELPVAAMKNMKKLLWLSLLSNELPDLDAEGFIENLPKLQVIGIDDNNFPCDRLAEIINVFKAKNIFFFEMPWDQTIKKRDYVPHKMKNILCLKQEQVD